MTRERGPYIIESDNDGHHYVIPKAREKEWSEWLTIASDDERSWKVPKYAEAVGGSPTLVTFDSYNIR
jgi:hypothetical protein